MRFRMRAAVGVALMLGAATAAFAGGPRLHRGPTAGRTSHGRTTVPRGGVHPASGSHLTMSSERATELQTALIKAGYLNGAPTGAWDQSSQAAMEKLQADNGWQTKLVPDSRAIIKLGLGPNSKPAAVGSTDAAAQTAASGTVQASAGGAGAPPLE